MATSAASRSTKTRRPASYAAGPLDQLFEQQSLNVAIGELCTVYARLSPPAMRRAVLRVVKNRILAQLQRGRATQLPGSAGRNGGGRRRSRSTTRSEPLTPV